MILLRHATSVLNQKVSDLLKYNPNTTFGDWLDLFTSKEYVDCGLTPHGIEQCLEAAKHI